MEEMIRGINYPQINFGLHRVVMQFDPFGEHGPENSVVLFYHANDRGDGEEIERRNFRKIRRTFGKVMRELPEPKT